MITPEGTGMFLAVLTPKINKKKPAAQPKYGAMIHFPSGSDLAEMKAAVAAKIQETWPGAKPARGGGWVALVNGKQVELNDPIRKSEEKATGAEGEPMKFEEPYEAGGHFINCSSLYPPGVVDELYQPIVDPAKIFNGIRCRAELTVFNYDTDGNRGVSFGLSNFHRTGPGKRISNRPDAATVFKAAPAATAPAGDYDDEHDPLS